MTPVIECVLSQSEAPSSNPSTTKTKQRNIIKTKAQHMHGNVTVKPANLYTTNTC
jgi:hypothetical protein